MAGDKGEKILSPVAEQQAIFRAGLSGSGSPTRCDQSLANNCTYPLFRINGKVQRRARFWRVRWIELLGVSSLVRNVPSLSSRSRNPSC